MKRKSFIFLLFSIFLSLGVMRSVVVADTDSENVTVVLHKRAWKNQIPEQRANSGKEMDFGGEPLPGVTFNVYEVTKRYYEAEKQPNFSVKDYMSAWSKKSLTELAKEHLGQPIATKVTDASGELSVDVPTKIDGKDGVYLFVETGVNVPKGFTVDQASSAPTMIILPVIDTPTNQSLSIIHLYPKNVLKQETVVPPTPVTPAKPDIPKKPVTPNKPILPHTGQQKSELAIIGFALIILVVVILIRRTKRKGEK